MLVRAAQLKRDAAIWFVESRGDWAMLPQMLVDPVEKVLSDYQWRRSCEDTAVFVPTYCIVRLLQSFPCDFSCARGKVDGAIRFGHRRRG